MKRYDIKGFLKTKNKIYYMESAAIDTAQKGRLEVTMEWCLYGIAQLTILETTVVPF